jgi:tRNA(adenine34) deaminase
MIDLRNKKDIDIFFMNQALEEAKKAFNQEEVPIGAVLVKDHEVIARAHNSVETFKDATMHAELLCIRKGSLYLQNWRLLNTTLYVTLEPCSMCLGALLLARVTRIVWGASDIRHGACGSWVNLLELKHPTHSLEIEKGVLEPQCALLLKDFFRLRRVKHEKSRADGEGFSSLIG